MKLNKYELTMLTELYASCLHYWTAKGLPKEDAKAFAIDDVRRMDSRNLLVIKGFFIDCIQYWERNGTKGKEAEQKAFEDIRRITIDSSIPIFPIFNEEAKVEFIEAISKS